MILVPVLITELGKNTILIDYKIKDITISQLQILTAICILGLFNYGIFNLMYWKNVKSFYSQTYFHFAVSSVIANYFVAFCLSSLFFINRQISFVGIGMLLLFYSELQLLIGYFKFSKTETYQVSAIKNSRFEIMIPYFSLLVWIIIVLVGGGLFIFKS